MAKILYFAGLVDKLGCASENAELPKDVTDVRALLSWLRTRGGAWEQALAENAVRITVNKQFATMQTAVDNSNEIAIVTARPG